MKKYYVVGTASIRAHIIAKDSEEAKTRVKGNIEAYSPTAMHIRVHEMTAIPKGSVKEEAEDERS